MKDNLLNEELSIMKSLFTHQRGVVISEQENVTQPDDELNKVLAPVGIKLTPEESEEAHQDCPIDMPSDEKEAGFVKQILNNLKGMSIPELVKELKGVLRIKDKPIEEQAGALATIMIAGVAVPTVIAVGIAAIIIIAIISAIASKIKSKGKRPKKSSCGKRRKLVSKFGMSGNFMKL
jgi:hypothetical protein